MKKRIAYLDVARGIGMILVVIGHVEFINRPFRNYVTSFHMPLFFIISGILLYVTKTEERDWKEILHSKGRSLLLPYFIFSAGALIFELVRALIKNLDMGSELLRRLFQTICLQGFSNFWFLPALFIGELVFLRIRKRFDLKRTGIIGIALTILMYVAALLEQAIYQGYADLLGAQLFHDVLLMLIRGVFSGCFVCLGYYMGLLLEKWESVLWKDILLGAVLSVIPAVICIFEDFIDIRYLNLGNPVLFLLRAICGAMGVILICRGFGPYLATIPGKVLGFFGQNSLVIMATHLDYRVLNYSIKAAALINGFIGNSVVYAVLSVCFVFLLETVVIYIINKFFYKILGRKTQK